MISLKERKREIGRRHYEEKGSQKEGTSRESVHGRGALGRRGQMAWPREATEETESKKG